MKRSYLSLFISITSCSFFYAHSAFAITPLSYQTENGIEITPSLLAQAGYTNNLLYTPTDQVNTATYILQPNVNVALETDLGLYDINYRLNSVFYTQSKEDNITEHEFDVVGNYLFNHRNRLRLSYFYNLGAEARGTGITEGLSLAVSEPLKYKLYRVTGKYIFGSDGARGRIIGEAGYQKKSFNDVTFLSNSNTTQAQYYNWSEPQLSFSFNYRFSSAFYAITTLKYENRHYPNIDPSVGISRDSQTTYLYGGLKWDITGNTSGEAVIGYQNKDYSDNKYSDFNGVSWRINLDWQPNDNTIFTFETSQFASDPDTQGDYVKNQIYSFGLDNHTTPLLRSTANSSFKIREYSGTSRKDEILEFDLALIYSLMRSIDLSIGMRWEDKKSHIAQFNYKQVQYLAGMEVGL